MASMAEAVAIRGNQILRVGSERDVMRLRKPQTTMVDAKGAAVLPGFNDSHVHFISGGLSLEHVDLAGADTLDEIQSRIGSWSATHVDAPWLIGSGWDCRAIRRQSADPSAARRHRLRSAGANHQLLTVTRRG